MFMYYFDLHHKRERESVTCCIDDIVSRAAVEIIDNLAMPIRIEDQDGNVVMDTEELNNKAWEYIYTHDI